MSNAVVDRLPLSNNVRHKYKYVSQSSTNHENREIFCVHK